MGNSNSRQSRRNPPATDDLDARLKTSEDALKSSMRRLVEQNIYSDMTVICEDDQYPVHRAIICLRSTWFEKKCREVIVGHNVSFGLLVVVFHFGSISS
jgi:hypothetical protein